MFKRLVARIKNRRAFKQVKKFLTLSKDYKVKEFVFVDKNSETFDDKFGGRSYYHYYCTDNGLNDARLDMYLPLENDTVEYYMTFFMISLQIVMYCGFKWKE